MDNETDSRIKKMTQIIIDEAKEKAEEIRLQTNGQFLIEKNKIFNAAKEKIILEMKDKMEKYIVKRRM